MQSLTLTDTDIRIWKEQIDPHLPEKVFDLHVHIFRQSDNLDASEGKVLHEWGDISYEDVQKAFELTMPGRQVRCGIMGYPFPKCDFPAMNDFIVGQGRDYPETRRYYVCNPGMSTGEIDRALSSGFCGLKPYRDYSKTGDIDNCRITDMVTEEQLDVVNRHGGILLLHMSKRDAVADPENQEDIKRLSRDFSRISFVLAHCARCFIPEMLDGVVDMLAEIPSVYVDTSAVCEKGVFDILLDRFPIDRILYGSDCAFPGWQRGKLAGFARSWALLTPDNHKFDLRHCDGKFTFIMYEELKALLSACKQAKVSQTDMQSIFYSNAAKLMKLDGELQHAG